MRILMRLKRGRWRPARDTLLSRFWLPACFCLLLSLQNQTASAQVDSSAGESSSSRKDQSGSSATSIDELARRLQQLERDGAKLAEQNAMLVRQLETMTGRADEVDLPTTRSGFDPAGTSGVSDSPQFDSPFTEPALPTPSSFLVGDYDQGAFVLVRSADTERYPFELRADLFTQVRASDFSRSVHSFVDSTGARFPVSDYNSTEVTRNFIQLSGYGLDPRLQFTAIIFSSTAINDTIYLGWINYEFSKAFDLRVGNWLVPGTREWYTSFRYTLGADRSMATTFFRPNISPGIWAQGEPIENFHYVVMVANSLNRFTQGVERVGSARSFGGSVWWEPLGAYGLGPSDIENHSSLCAQVGTSTAVSGEANQGATDAGLGNPEDTILRLSDGTPLFRPGALGPGVGLASTDVQLWAIDAAVKYRGMSISGEYLLRWLDNFQFVGVQSPIRSLFDHGGLLQAGYFVIPKKLEPYARTSCVTGQFGSGNEYGGGVNWYPKSSRELRITAEVLRINRSPAENLLTGYRAGESGTLFQLQCIVDF